MSVSLPADAATALVRPTAPAAAPKPSPAALDSLDSLASATHSRFVQRVRRRWPEERALLPPGLPDAAAIRALVAALQSHGRSLPSALRVARQVVVERLAVLDIEAGAGLNDVTATMTHLAEVALEAGLAEARQEADARHGPPLDEQGQPIELWIVGMGKLGARELNVSSDIDLVYVYERDGHTHGLQPVSAQEYFGVVARRLHTLIGDTTEDGFVFRVDLALRPNGQSGPPAVSLAMLQDYLLKHGREWERFAWLKSRVVAPRAAVDSGRAQALATLVVPFVYRRYLDYGVFEGLRQLHRRVRDEAQRRAAGRPERANDVKLSRGGIREIEFIVQLQLVVRGGQFPEIRTRSTVKGLRRLVAAGLMRPADAQALVEGYEFLRQVEHRIQYLDDQQTHLLPSNDADLGWIARSMGLTCDPDTCRLLERFGEVREAVAQAFDALLHDGRAPSPVDAASGCRQCGPGPLPVDSDELLAHLPTELADRIRPWRDKRVLALRDDSKLRLGRLVKRAAMAVAAGECTTDAALRFVDWLEPLLRRESYLALLVERPEVQTRLLRLLGLARWPMRYLMQHPGVIDELADNRLLEGRFDRRAFLRELSQRHEAWMRSGEAGEASEESLLDTLRRAHHAETFRTLVRDVEGRLEVEQVSDDLSALADAVLQSAMQWAWDRLKQRHREAPRFAAIAYGKLGGLELGYGSDLDLVFVYDDSDEADPDLAQEIYGAFVRKLITWLTVHTATGDLYDIDTALRPNGNSGMLVSSISAFERYQQGRGGNTAWTWEHQAITRARFCAGDPALAPRFEATRRAVLAAERDVPAVKREVIDMRAKVRQAHRAKAGRFDVKHDEGGMMDVEFAVQFFVLAHAVRHPALLDNVGNIALLQHCEEAGLIEPGLGRAAGDAYRELRRAQHRARLDERPTTFEEGEFSAERAAVRELWRVVAG
jgi:[glutamine synthetase] adenylyltransferase / [glutamine synthetase]-adenylyl-L-tyrosine phosphorylase